MIFANSPNVPLFNFEGWRSSSEKETTAPRQSKQEVVGRWEHLLPNLWSHPFLPPSFFLMNHQVSQVQKKARIYFTWISELFLLGDLKTLRAWRNACWILRRHNANCQHIGIPRKGFLAVNHPAHTPIFEPFQLFLPKSTQSSMIPMRRLTRFKCGQQGPLCHRVSVSPLPQLRQ